LLSLDLKWWAMPTLLALLLWAFAHPTSLAILKRLCKYKRYDLRFSDRDRVQ
jgi:hypothetical protein